MQKSMWKQIELVGQSAFLLFVRIYWGWQFIESGLGKLRHIDKPIEFFTSLNIPVPHITAYVVGCTELICGGLLIVGLISRPAAAALTLVMLGAYYYADFEALTSIYSDPSTFVGATPFGFLFASLVVLLFGAGLASLDALIFRRRH
jgi:putative oxidoreductase